jgi:hypothetical protein
VPEYAASLEQTLGPGGVDAIVGGVVRQADEMLGLGRTLFERWFDRVVLSSERLVEV